MARFSNLRRKSERECSVRKSFSTATWNLGFLMLLTVLLPQSASAQGNVWIPKFQIKPPVNKNSLGYSLQLWGDVAYCNGYRIQHNVFSSKYRLLDPQNDCEISGTLEKCEQALTNIKKREKLPKMSGTVVVLIHGIMRSSQSFTKMAQELKNDKNESYTVIGFDYPSTHVNITQSADYLHQFLQSLEGVERIFLVTHSMGGLVVRCYLQNHNDKRIERMVMIGVPNHGAKMADILGDQLMYKLIYGPAGQQLVTKGEFIKALPTPKFDFGVIAGSRGKAGGYNPLLPGDDDGTVSVSSSRLAGARDFATVESLHSVILNQAETITYTRRFLKTGQFRKCAEKKQPITRLNHRAIAPQMR